jgi:hypothetical protein
MQLSISFPSQPLCSVQGSSCLGSLGLGSCYAKGTLSNQCEYGRMILLRIRYVLYHVCTQVVASGEQPYCSYRFGKHRTEPLIIRTGNRQETPHPPRHCSVLGYSCNSYLDPRDTYRDIPCFLEIYPEHDLLSRLRAYRTSLGLSTVLGIKR